ncbi:MAG: hypothetical protein JRI94_00010 [Deltaproteobacteria bacterium]|nr:hypothetical protein [Deltaproteobacteria bacterium]MBW2031965.1 hypothetical protein [Deltaproteobacteria bacterium]
MRPKQINFDTLANDTDYLASSQQLAAAGYLALLPAAAGKFIPQKVTLTSAGNIATVVFTIVGLGQNGEPQTEDITGINGNTVASTLYYTAITSIYGDAGTGASSVEAGINGIASFIYPVDPYCHGNRIMVSGTFVATYTVFWSNQKILAGETPVWVAEADQTDKTGVTGLHYDGGITAFKYEITAYTSGAPVFSHSDQKSV